MLQYMYNADIFRSKADALVNPVNCRGVMGKGLAKQFKERFPTECRWFNDVCLAGEAEMGTVYPIATTSVRPEWIIHFPTKLHWRDKSLLEDIAHGLDALVERVEMLDINSVAVPALGCGEGGLPWPVVKALIEAHLGRESDDTRWDVYPPHV